jgi:hypothetical protein
MKHWIQSVFIIFVVIGILGLSVEMVSFRYWVTARQEVSRLYVDLPRHTQGTIGENHLAGLPEAVQKWLRGAGIIGQMPISSVRTRMEFSMAWNHRESWRDGISHLYVNAVEPGFVWMGTSKELPFVRLCGKSVFLKDREEETYPLLSMGRAQILQGEKLREKMQIEYLSYLPWMPAAAVKDDLQWEGLPDNQVRVTLTQGSNTGEGIFSFHSDGFPAAFEARMPVFENGGFVYRTIRVTYTGYMTSEGFRIPEQVLYFWLDDGSETGWMEFRHTDTDYNSKALFNSF